MEKKIFPIKIQGDRSTFFIYWKLTDFCNFRCNYCPVELHAGVYAKNQKLGYPTDVEITTFLENLKKEYIRDRRLNLILSGGEPTFHPLFPLIVSTVSNLGYTGVTTNGSRPLKWWKALDVLPNSFTLSLHPEFTKLDKINTLYDFLVEQGKTVFFNLMADTTNWDKVVSLYEGLSNHAKTKVHVRALINLTGDKNPITVLNQAQTDWVSNVNNKTLELNIDSMHEHSNRFQATFNDGTIVKNFNYLLANNFNNFRGWKCSAGTDGIVVNYDGSVYAGICQQQFLGRLDNFSLLTNYVFCNQESCTNPGDIRLDKFRTTGENLNLC